LTVSAEKFMDQFKIDNFVATHPGIAFPAFRHLSSEECAPIRVTVAGKLGLPSNADGLALVRTLETKAGEIQGTSPSDLEFVPSKLLAQFRILPQEIYINWYRFNDVDAMSTGDVDQAFHDIWYPSSDDIEIFDQSLSWFLLITHFETLKLLRE
jgi:hypothetical protein